MWWLLACAAPPPLDVLPLAPAPAALHVPGRTLNIAHRGGDATAPEATLPALAAAVEAGADILELDLHRTADGVVVALHDDELDRTTDGQGPLSALSFEALRRMDAGYRWTADGGQSHPWRGRGVVVPTLREALDSHPATPFILEIKDGPASVPAVLADLETSGALARVVLAAQDGETLEAIRAAAPAVPTALSFGEVVDFVLADADWVPPARFLMIPPAVPGLDLVSPERLAQAEALGLVVQVWTINERAEMVRLRDLGVHGIFSDQPAALSHVLNDAQ